MKSGTGLSSSLNTHGSAGHYSPPLDNGADRLAHLAASLPQRKTALFDGGSGIGDTAVLLRHDAELALEADNGASTDIFKLLNELVDAAPDRGDLWMMRFETLRSLGLKTDFAHYLKQACINPVVQRKLDGPSLRQMWREVARDEPLPSDVQLPDDNLQSSAVVVRRRRFADTALRIAWPQLAALANSYSALRSRPGFFQDFARKLGPLLGRPTRLHHAAALSQCFDTPVRIFIKREDLRHVSPETENAAAQACIASMLGKKLLVSANDTDEHSLELAGMAPRFDLQCLIVMHPQELERKSELVNCLHALDAQVQASTVLMLDTADPREAALRLWRQAPAERHLALSPGSGPSPYPTMMGDLQALIGHETELQLRSHAGMDRPRTFVAAVHSQANSLGFMLPQLVKPQVELVYTEPAPSGTTAWHPAGRVAPYNSAMREHAALRASHRLIYVPVSDSDARNAQRDARLLENVTLSLEDARALAFAGLLAAHGSAPRDFVVLAA